MRDGQDFKQKLERSVALTSKADMLTLTKPIAQNFALSHFCYIKSFADGTHLLLCTDSEWVQCFYLNYYQNAPYHKVPAGYKSGYELWCAQPQQTVFNASRDYFNIDHGITLIQKNAEYCEFLNFATTRDNPAIINFYINNMDLLFNFGMFFKEKATALINKAYEDRLILPKCLPAEQSMNQSVVPVSTWQERHNFMNATKPKRYIIKTAAEETYLTSQEFSCVLLLMKGKTTKEIAKALKIKPRTVEAHIDNIRTKLNCHTKVEVVTKIIANGFIKLPEFL